MMNRELEFLLKEKYGYSASEIFLAEEKLEEFPDYVLKDINKLKKGYPLDYLIGFKEFFDCKIDLRYKPLIPRIETEYWVERALHEIPIRKNILALDIFCGSGCIGISVMKHIKETNFFFLDVSTRSINQTKFNLDLNGFKDDRYEVIQSDLFKAIENQDIRFDYIFANPPYVAIGDENIGKEIKHEPSKALYADDSGLSVIKEFLRHAIRYLSSDGKIFMEFGYDQKDIIDTYLTDIDLYKKWTFHKDQFGVWRWVEIR